MYIKNKMLDLNKIDIEDINNDKVYATLAFIVDSDEFLEHIQNARRSIGIDNLISYDQVDKWLHPKLKITSLIKMSFGEKKLFKRILQTNTIVENIKSKFRLNDNYTEIIKYSILAGKITDKELTHSAFCIEYPFPHNFNENEFGLTSPMVAIFVNSDTNLKEIAKLFKTKVKKAFEEQKVKTLVPLRESSNIRRDRKWYWQQKDGLSIQKIANQDNNGYSENRDYVAKAIKQFKKNLLYKVN